MIYILAYLCIGFGVGIVQSLEMIRDKSASLTFAFETLFFGPIIWPWMLYIIFQERQRD